MSEPYKKPYSVGDKIRIKRSNGTASDAVVKKSMIHWVGTVDGRLVIKESKIYVPLLGRTLMDKGNSYVATQLYEVTVLNEDGSETSITKIIPRSEVLATYLGPVFGAHVDSSFFNDDDDDDDEGAPGAPSAQDGGKNMKRAKRTKRTKRAKRTKRTKRAKRTKYNNRRR